jgi:hypothetical protein
MFFKFEVSTQGADALPHLQSLVGVQVVVNGGLRGYPKAGQRGEVLTVEDIGLKLRTLRGEEWGIPWEGIKTLEII